MSSFANFHQQHTSPTSTSHYTLTKHQQHHRFWPDIINNQQLSSLTPYLIKPLILSVRVEEGCWIFNSFLYLYFFPFLSPSLFRLDYSHCEPVICCLKDLLSINLVSFCLLLFLLRLCAKNWLRRINASAHLWSYFMFFLIILIGLTKRDWDACLIVFSRAHILFLSVFIHFISLFIFITTVCALVSSL